MKEKDINEYTYEELLAIKNCEPTKPFNNIIIVPTEDIHDSGFRCMKFVLELRGEFVGCVSGWSDVIHFNGIGGRGRWPYQEPYKPIDYKIDCLKESRCIRIMTYNELELDQFIGSDFIFYVTEKEV